jgi:hypothetical protein
LSIEPAWISIEFDPRDAQYKQNFVNYRAPLAAGLASPGNTGFKIGKTLAARLWPKMSAFAANPGPAMRSTPSAFGLSLGPLQYPMPIS